MLFEQELSLCRHEHEQKQGDCINNPSVFCNAFIDVFCISVWPGLQIQSFQLGVRPHFKGPSSKSSSSLGKKMNEEASCNVISGFPKLGVPFFNNKDYSILGSTLGPLVLGNYHFKQHVAARPLGKLLGEPL